MVFSRKINPKKRALACILRSQNKCSFGKIAKTLKISKSSASRLVQEGIDHGEGKQKANRKRGRKPALSERDQRHLIRGIHALRKEDVNFTVKRLVEFCGFSPEKASYRTYVRYINKEGFSFRQTRKKGVLTEVDKKKRLAFAKKMRKIVLTNQKYWEKDVSFFLDGVSFIHKRNPLGEAMKPQARVWRKRHEGLTITAKGSKDLAGGKRLHLMVAISYKAGVVAVEKYEHMDGNYFQGFIKRHFKRCLRNTYIPGVKKRLFVMDNCPCQNSCKAKKQLKTSKAKLLEIPARSPDINCIENIFHIVKKKLLCDAKRKHITKETFEQFEERVIQTIYNISDRLLKKTISSMPKRMEAIIKVNGGRTKY